MEHIGDIYCDSGKFAAAEELLGRTAKTKRAKDPDVKAHLNISLGDVRMFRGRPDALDLFAKAREYFESVGDENSTGLAIGSQAYGELFAGNNLAAKRYFEEEISIYIRLDDIHSRSEALMGLSEIEVRQGNFSDAHKYLDEARELAFKGHDVPGAGATLSLKAALSTDQGFFELARNQIARAISETTISNESENCDMATCVYIGARNELFAQEYHKAKELFHRAMGHFNVLSDVRFKARSTRALGEIALLEKDCVSAKAWFTETKLLCDFMGIPPELLYICFNCYALRDTVKGWVDCSIQKDPFKGWAMFQEGCLLPA